MFSPFRRIALLSRAIYPVFEDVICNSCKVEGDTLNRQQTQSAASSTEGGETVRIRTPDTRERELLGTVTDLLGGSRVMVRCMDSVTRMCRIRGKMKKRSWVREGDIVIVVPWDFQDEKGDIIWRYTGPQADWLQRKGFLRTT